MITSTSNIQVKELLRLQKKSREREKEGVFIVEGPRMAEEIPRERIVKLYVSESFQAKCVKEKNDRFIQEAEVMSDTVFAHVSDTKTPQGILAVVRRMEYTAEDILGETPHVLVLENIQDPGNLGTIFRTAAACGFCDIYLLDTADIYSPKVVRATLGTLFKVRACQIDEEQAISLCKSTSSAVLDMDGENKPKAPILFVSGNEAHGVRDILVKNAKKIYSLPMQNDVESLNVAVATAVAMYQSI